ncbi:type II toxin-antitoxin system RelE/ParE family toxin [Candidatus Nomurabacteria bacterium]|jgi:mRNA interferase RelE/StbE|nr:type II toxin-antitoxin system RelE/ParE family toxin [Candidatus Nomurabacteria bacterium]
MNYKVEFTKDALKQLKKTDRHTALLITSWIRKNLEGCTDPRLHGKGLTADRIGQWRYRIGDYRLIAEIFEDKVLIMILNIGHRREIYK